MISRPRIAIVGASARAAAFSAERAGLRPVTADLFADADLQRRFDATVVRNYPTGFHDWLRQVEVDAWMYCGGLENYPRLVDRMADVQPLWGNRGRVLRQVRSVEKLATAFCDAGLVFPETRASTDGLPTDGSWLEKTRRGSGGSGVSVWRGTGFGGQRSAIDIQRRLEGRPLAALFIASGGVARLLGVSRQLVGTGWTGARPFQYCGSVAPWPASDEQIATIQRIGGVLADCFDLRGLFGVDMIAGDDGIWTLEVNPRYTASVEVIERSTRMRLLSAHVTACRDSTLPDGLSSAIGQPAGKAILFAPQSIRISAEFHRWATEQSLREPWPELADVPAAGTPIEKGRPVLTVLNSAASIELVEADLKSRIAEVEARLVS